MTFGPRYLDAARGHKISAKTLAAHRWNKFSFVAFLDANERTPSTVEEWAGLHVELSHYRVSNERCGPAFAGVEFYFAHLKDSRHGLINDRAMKPPDLCYGMQCPLDTSRAC